MADTKSMSLADLQDFLAKVEDSAGRDAALREAFLEVGSAMADILSLLEKQGPEMAKAIAQALKDIKVDAQEKGSEIRIDVKPTPVEVNVAAPIVHVAAPNVTMAAPAQAKRGGWTFDVDPKPGGGFKINAKPTA